MMNKKIKLVVSLLGIVVSQDTFAHTWTHLELGAGNYGAEGETLAAQEQTVLKALTFVSDKPNYIKKLPVKGHGTIDSSQYQILFWTLDELVKKYGPKGVFHVNDLVEEYSDFATMKLKGYAESKGYSQVEISSVPGDYSRINPTETLVQYQRTNYDSVHLKNPDISIYHFGLDGNRLITNQETRAKARTLLQQLANLSSTGLYFFPNDYKDFDNDFIPEEEKAEFINKEIFYLSTQDWESVPYIFPNGMVYGKEYGRVYFIQRNTSAK